MRYLVLIRVVVGSSVLSVGLSVVVSTLVNVEVSGLGSSLVISVLVAVSRAVLVTCVVMVGCGVHVTEIVVVSSFGGTFVETATDETVLVFREVCSIDETEVLGREMVVVSSSTSTALEDDKACGVGSVDLFDRLTARTIKPPKRPIAAMPATTGHIMFFLGPGRSCKVSPNGGGVDLRFIRFTMLA